MLRDLIRSRQRAGRIKSEPATCENTHPGGLNPLIRIIQGASPEQPLTMCMFRYIYIYLYYLVDTHRRIDGAPLATPAPAVTPGLSGLTDYAGQAPELSPSETRINPLAPVGASLTLEGKSLIEIKYVAVPDPEDCAQMTFWRVDRYDRLVAWPNRASYGPTLWRVSGPGRSHVIPAGLKGGDRREWVQRWFHDVRASWMNKVCAVIDGDRVAAGATFAALSTCCAACGKSLRDPASRTRALGSDCVKKFSAETIAALSREVGRAYAAHLAGDEEGALMSRAAAYADADARRRDADSTLPNVPVQPIRHMEER